MVAAFRQALDRRAGARIAAVEEVKIDGFTAMQTGGALPPDRYLALRRKHAAAEVLALFFAFPPLSGAELNGLGCSSKPGRPGAHDRIVGDGKRITFFAGGGCDGAQPSIGPQRFPRAPGIPRNEGPD